MSHHLDADLAYLEALADCGTIGYVGLLGPAPRRDRLLAALGARAARLEGRLRAPIGLDIGARTPEAIALAAAGELHAWFAGRGGGPFHARSADDTGVTRPTVAAAARSRTCRPCASTRRAAGTSTCARSRCSRCRSS